MLKRKGLDPAALENFKLQLLIPGARWPPLIGPVICHHRDQAMAEMIGRDRSSALRALLRLFQILGVLARHKVLGALFGRRHWPTPVQVREAFEELGLVFLKFGQVLAMRHDLLPAACIDESELLHDDLPPMSFDVVRSGRTGIGQPVDSVVSVVRPDTTGCRHHRPGA